MGAIRPPWGKLLRDGGAAVNRPRASAASSVIHESRVEPPVDNDEQESIVVPPVGETVALANDNVVEGSLTIEGYEEGTDFTVDYEAGVITNLTMPEGDVVTVDYFWEEPEAGGGGGGGSVTGTDLNDRGAWSPTDIYMRGDLVSYDNRSWFVRVDNLSGVTPVEGEYYMLFAGPGPPGEPGEDGADGAPGATGAPGAPGFTIRVRSNGTLMPLRPSMNFRSGFVLGDDTTNDWINIDGTGGSGGTGGAASYTSLVKLGAV